MKCSYCGITITNEGYVFKEVEGMVISINGNICNNCATRVSNNLSNAFATKGLIL